MDAELSRRLADEVTWLRAHPEFAERPADIRSFIGPNYLDIEETTRESVLEVLVDIFGEHAQESRIAQYQQALFSGGIGVGKTTVAAVSLAYMAHWLLCLRNPQRFFDLMPGSRIALMMMSTSAPQAREVVFGDVKARIDNSPWFRTRPYDPIYKNQIRFARDIWIIPGDSQETTFEGYNVLAGVLDEGDSHQLTKLKDYAEHGYTTIFSRMTSRFQDRGLVIVIGQMKRSGGFMERKYWEFKRTPNAYAVRMTIWESFGWKRFTDATGRRQSFWFDSKRHEICTEAIAVALGSPDHIIEIPEVYRRDFLNNPIKALRDLAGVPPAVLAPFLSNPSKIDDARRAWVDFYGITEGPVDPYGNLADWFKCQNNFKHVIHIDIGLSGTGDALGLAMGHVGEMMDIEGEMLPVVDFDLLMRWKVRPGNQIMLADVRQFIYRLRDERKFKIDKVTVDGFQGVEMRQLLERRRINTDLVSIDKNMGPYTDLIELLTTDRLRIPPYMTHLNFGDLEMCDVVYKELSELSEINRKIDHPPEGSKDLTDAMAGVAFALVGNRTYQRFSKTWGGSPSGDPVAVGMSSGLPGHPAIRTDFEIPRTPTMPSKFTGDIWTPVR